MGVYLDTDADPDLALSDAATMLPLDTAGALLGDLAKLHEACVGLGAR